MHYFGDWGVVTYRSGSITDATSTFLSFKSGKLHGRAVYDYVHSTGNPKAVRDKWRRFNPGHEHPDQNSFTFSPAGRRLVTDGLYGPKRTYLNNVLMLSPGNASECTRPWTGQLGDCYKWLSLKTPHEGRSHGRIVTTQLLNKVVFIAGEAVGAYHGSLRLRRVYRSLVLLKSDLLVVIDDVHLMPDSQMTHVSAFFNNHERRFTVATHAKSQPTRHGVRMLFDDGIYGIVWTSAGGQSPAADITVRNYISGRGRLFTSNVNVTYTLEGRHTRLVHIMYGPNTEPTSFRLERYSVLITTEQDSYNIAVKSDDNDVSSPLCSVTSILHDTVTFYHSEPHTGSFTFPHSTENDDDDIQHLMNSVQRGREHVPQDKLHEPEHPQPEPNHPQHEPHLSHLLQHPPQLSLPKPHRQLREPQYTQENLNRSHRPPHEYSVTSPKILYLLFLLGGTYIVVSCCTGCRFTRYTILVYSIVFMCANCVTLVTLFAREPTELRVNTF